MARFPKNTPPNPKYQQILESRDKVHLLLQDEGVENAGVGVGYRENSEDLCLVIQLEKPLPPKIEEKVKDWYSDIEIEVVDSATAY
jgi:hypothetical protein